MPREADSRDVVDDWYSMRETIENDRCKTRGRRLTSQEARAKKALRKKPPGPSRYQRSVAKKAIEKGLGCDISSCYSVTVRRVLERLPALGREVGKNHKV